MTVADKASFILQPIAAGLPSSQPATKNVLSGSNIGGFLLAFADSEVQTAFWSMATGSFGQYQAGVRILVLWRSTATAGDVYFRVSLVNTVDGDPSDESFPADTALNVTPKATSNQLNVSEVTIPSFQFTNDTQVSLRLKRDPTAEPSAMAGDAEVLQVVVIPNYRGALEVALDTAAINKGAALVKFLDTLGFYAGTTLQDVATKIAQYLIDLSTPNVATKGAVMVGVQDTGNHYIAQDVEGVLQEIPTLWPDIQDWQHISLTTQLNGARTRFAVAPPFRSELTSMVFLNGKKMPVADVINTNPANNDEIEIHVGGVPYAPLASETLEIFYIQL